MSSPRRKLYLTGAIALLLVLALCYALYRVFVGPGGGGKTSGEDELSGGAFEFDQQRYLPEDGSAPRQLIIFYTGDTLSIPESNDSYSPPQGGLPALAQTLLDYQRRIVRFNQQRIDSLPAAEGAGLALLGVDSGAGLLGEHPYLLLDYGGWERLNDPAGEVYVGLYGEYFSHFNYTAVGSKHFSELSEAMQLDYSAAAPQLEVLVSAGPAQSDKLPRLSCITREVHGEKWGIAAIALPDIAGLSREAAMQEIADSFEARLDEAAAVLSEHSVARSILMAPGWGAAQFERLARDPRFDIVLGASVQSAHPAGHGPLPSDGPLLLPELLPRGRQLAVCHLYWPVGEAEPDMYYLTLLEVQDQPDKPYPFRKQVPLAGAQHQEKLVEKTEAAKIQGQ